MKKIKYTLPFTLILMLASFIIGCSSQDGYTTTGAITGAGYKISLTVPETVAPGGTGIIKAQILDSNGYPVIDDTKVTFTASLGSLTPSEATTKNGVAISVYTPPKDSNSKNPLAPLKVKISVSSMGALTWSNELTIPYGFSSDPRSKNEY